MVVSKLNYLAKKMYLLNNIELVTDNLSKYYGDAAVIESRNVGKTRCIRMGFKEMLDDGEINDIESLVSKAISSSLGFDEDFPVYSLFNISHIDSCTLLVEV